MFPFPSDLKCLLSKAVTLRVIWLLLSFYCFPLGPLLCSLSHCQHVALALPLIASSFSSVYSDSQFWPRRILSADNEAAHRRSFYFVKQMTVGAVSELESWPRGLGSGLRMCRIHSFRLYDDAFTLKTNRRSFVLWTLTSAAYVGLSRFVSRTTGAAGRRLSYPLPVFTAKHAGRLWLLARRRHGILHAHALSLQQNVKIKAAVTVLLFLNSKVSLLYTPLLLWLPAPPASGGRFQGKRRRRGAGAGTSCRTPAPRATPCRRSGFGRPGKAPPYAAPPDAAPWH